MAPLYKNNPPTSEPDKMIEPTEDKEISNTHGRDHMTFHTTIHKFKKSTFITMKVSKVPLSKIRTSEILSAINLHKIRARYKNPFMKKEYDLSKLSKRDKGRLRPFHDKFQTVNALPAYLVDMSRTYDVYFSTFTFDKTYLPKVYEEFFYFFRRKLDQSLNVSGFQNDIATVMIMTPEARPMLHYHGFLLVHKSKLEKFHKSCVDKIVLEHVPDIKMDKDVVYLKSRILTADSLQMKETLASIRVLKEQEERLRKTLPDNTVFQKKPFTQNMLQHAQVVVTKGEAERKREDLRIYERSKVSTYRIFQITNMDEFFHTQFYSSKDFINNRRFTSSDVLWETKPTNSRK